MTRLNVSKARDEFPEVVNRAAYGKERTIVSRRWKDMAAVIPMHCQFLLREAFMKVFSFVNSANGAERVTSEEIDEIYKAGNPGQLKPGRVRTAGMLGDARRVVPFR